MIEPQLIVINSSKGGVVLAGKVQMARTSIQRLRGLLDHQSLDSDEGLYLAPTRWIHTLGMRFPIDLAWLAHDGRILAIHHRLRPNRFSKISWRSSGVLELCAGRLREMKTEVGDIIKLIPVQK
jgi:uncharacterized protein